MVENLQGESMDKKLIVKRIDELIEEKHITSYQLKENAEISSTIYQWRKNTKRDATRTPSLRSIEKVCEFLKVSLSYFFAFDKGVQKDIKSQELTEEINLLTEEERWVVESLIQMIIKNR